MYQKNVIEKSVKTPGECTLSLCTFEKQRKNSWAEWVVLLNPAHILLVAGIYPTSYFFRLKYWILKVGYSTALRPSPNFLFSPSGKKMKWRDGFGHMIIFETWEWGDEHVYAFFWLSPWSEFCFKNCFEFCYLRKNGTFACLTKTKTWPWFLKKRCRHSCQLNREPFSCFFCFSSRLTLSNGPCVLLPLRVWELTRYQQWWWRKTL